MKKFIVLTFLFLGWGFYEMSGGADFAPDDRNIETAAAAEAAPEPAPEELVARASTRSTVIDVPKVAPASQQRGGAAEAVVVQAALTTDTPEVAPQEAPIQFESLVAGAPRVADILPDTEIAVSAPLSAPTLTQEPRVSGEIRQVAGNRVNMRSGPGTNYGVLVTLTRGTDVEVLEVDANGWARLRSIGTGQEGWMAERLLTGG